MKKRRELKPFELEAAKRLKAAFEQKKETLGLTQEKAAFACGWKSQSAIQQYLNGNVPLNLKALLLICNVLKIDPAEISKEIAQPVGESFQLGIATEDTSAPALQRGNTAHNYPNIKEVYPGYTASPLCKILSWVQAGDFSEIIDDYQGEIACPVKHGSNTFVLIVSGESMMPNYRDGEYIYIDPDKQPNHNDDIIVQIEGENTATFKRLQIVDGKKYIKPINPNWPEPIIEINSHATIVGVVIFAGRDITKRN